MFLTENINVEHLIKHMNGHNNGHEEYLTGRKCLFVGKAKSELSSTKFSSTIQEKNKSITLFARKFNSFLNISFPNEIDSNTNILVIDTFLYCLRDDDQKKKYTDMVQTLIDDYGYNEDSAEEILTYASNNLWRDS